MPAGQPPKYKTADELQLCVDEYFEGIRLNLDDEGNGPKPTISGLALHLGFESRQSIYDYEKREGFSYTIKRARLMIEDSYEQQLRQGEAIPGAIFGLKNLGWSDEKGVKLSGDPENPIEHNVVVEFIGLDVDSQDT